MERIITGSWDGKEISRPRTMAETLAYEIAKTDELRKLRVKDANEQDICPTCTEAPGIIFCEDGSGDERNYWTEECPTCEGRGFVDPIVEVTRVTV